MYATSWPCVWIFSSGSFRAWNPVKSAACTVCVCVCVRLTRVVKERIITRGNWATSTGHKNSHSPLISWKEEERKKKRKRERKNSDIWNLRVNSHFCGSRVFGDEVGSRARGIIGDKIVENVGRDNYGIHVNFQSWIRSYDDIVFHRTNKVNFIEIYFIFSWV